MVYGLLSESSLSLQRLQTAQKDIELWNAFKEGDRKAFADLFKQYYPLLVQYGSKLCPDEEQLQDCVQELFIELWQSESTAPIQSVKAYLLRALKYKIFRLYRKQNKIAEISEDMAFEISHENFLINSLDEQHKVLRIVNAVKQLPHRQKEIVYLKLYQQLSYEELGEIMQINYQAARNLFYQAIKSLRKLLS
jgi:RNA polymerase sigma-70 factor (ECF subfamily)